MSEEAFHAFVAERSTALLRTATMLTGDRDRGLDLLQTALVTAHRHWDAAADREAATAAVRRHLVAAHTGWWHRLDLGDLLAESGLLAGTAGLPGFGRPAADAASPDELTTALSRLPPRLRAALVLRSGEGLSEAETADALGGRAEDVAGWTARGFAGLRRLLDAGGTDDGALAQRLRRHLAGRAAGVPAAPADTAHQVLDAVRAQRRHRAGLAALAAFLVLVVLLVVITL